MPNKKTISVKGKKFEVPNGQLYCKKCKTTNFIYPDMKPPYFCADCGKPLKADTLQEIDMDEAQYEHEEGKYDGEL